MTDEFILQPNVYNTHGRKTLLDLLEEHWIHNVQPGVGTIYIVSGFGNYNGGVRFYDIFKNHIERGGSVHAMFAGSTRQKLTSKQVIEELLNCGVKVSVLNRRRLMHAKCYGYKSDSQQSLIVTSGNFTGPGMSQNVEAAVGLTKETLNRMNFDWNEFYNAYHSNGWDLYEPSTPIDNTAPEWNLLYNEIVAAEEVLEDFEEMTMILTLGHADTVRINAQPGTNESKGTQYFWLSKDAFDFFPALTIPNRRGIKPTYSTVIGLKYIDLSEEEFETRVTFEAGNNVDFRLGTGPLRNTRLAQEGDLVAITRRAHAKYELKIFEQGSRRFADLERYAINFIGHRGKKFGYIPNDQFERIIENN